MSTLYRDPQPSPPTDAQSTVISDEQAHELAQRWAVWRSFEDEPPNDVNAKPLDDNECEALFAWVRTRIHKLSKKACGCKTTNELLLELADLLGLDRGTMWSVQCLALCKDAGVFGGGS